MQAQLIEAWRTNNRINMLLMDRITDEGMSCTLSKRGGRGVAGEFAHIHNVRVWHLQKRAKDLAEGLAIFETKAITHLELFSERRILSCHKQNGVWITTAGVDTVRGDTDVIETVLGRLHAVRSTEIIESTPETIAEYLSPSERILRIWSDADSTPTTFLN